MSFIQKYIINFFLKKVWAYCLDLFQTYFRNKQRDKEQKKAEEAFNQALDDQTLSPEERAKKYAEAINAGRKP